MSGHSKWSKVKHQKESTDAVKGKIFTKLANAIIIAVKTGGGDDPASNFKLRLAIEKAKSFNMPKDNISRAIDRANKSASLSAMNEILYEAFGPYGVGILIKSATVNKQKTVSELKNILERNGGILAASGAVSHMFSQVGAIEIIKNDQNSEKILEKSVEIGALDYEDLLDRVIIYTNASELHKVCEFIEKAGINIISADLFFKPTAQISIKKQQEIDKINNLIAVIEEREDVTRVFSNYSFLLNV